MKTVYYFLMVLDILLALFFAAHDSLFFAIAMWACGFYWWLKAEDEI